MKALMVLALSSLCTLAMADDGVPETAQSLPVEQYDYSMHLDIARVIKSPQIPNVCEVVPVRMTYEDSQQKRHVLEYEVMGSGCTS
jgi:hypothetical protein